MVNSKKNKTKILLASPEVMPFAGTGGLGEVAGSLPAALNNLEEGDMDCRVITPLYSAVSDEWRQQMKFLGHMEVPVAWRSQYMGLFELVKDDVIYYFVDNEYYFKRDGLYGHWDDCERFSFFSRAVIEAARITGFEPDIINASDWQTALIPIYKNTIYKDWSFKTVFTIHNIEYQGRYGLEVNGNCIGIDEKDAYVLEYDNDVNLVKGAIDSCDKFSTVSPTYARELAEPVSAFGLHEVIQRNQYKMQGILNGINTVSYDPENDVYIPYHFSASKTQNKVRCKKALQKELGLPVGNAPLVTLVSRLVAPKGVDIITEILDDLLYNNDMQFVMLGTGDGEYEAYFRGLQERHPEQVVSMIEFDTAKAHKLYAAGDMLLMPSRSEACGLAQMIACRYGNVPIVRLTGGLADSIKEWDGQEGNGFTFYDYNGWELRQAIERALALYSNRKEWMPLEKAALNSDFTWDRSAKVYREMYLNMLG